MKITALVSVTCLKVVRMNNQDVLMNLMETTNVKMFHRGKHPNSVTADKGFEKPLTFLQTRSGDIIRIIHEKEAKPSVISIKKSILSNFIVKMAGQTGVETTQAGQVKFQYEKSVTKDGTDIILKKAVEMLKPADPKQKLRDAKYEQTSYIQVNTDGKLHKVSSEVGTKIGKPSPRQHKAYEAEKSKVGQEEHPEDFKTTPEAANAFNFNSVSILQLKKTGHFKGDKVELDETPQTLSMEDIEENLEEDQAVGTMGLDPALLVETREHYKNTLRKETDFHRVLSQVRGDTTNMRVLAEAQHYVAVLGEEAIDHVVNEFTKLSLNHKDHADYGVSLLNLMAASQTDKGQEALTNAMRHHATVQQAVLTTLSLEKPNEKTVEALRTLSEQSSIDGLDDEATLDVKTNAYLCYAHAASKLPVEHSHVILNEITNNLQSVKTLADMETHVHALSNAGDAAPVEALALLATNEHIPLSLRVAAIDGLGHRIQQHNSEEVTTLLHHLTEKVYNEHIRTQAVTALTRREVEMQESSSVQFLKQYLEDPKTPATMVLAIKNYLLEVGSDEAHRILDSTKLGESGHIGDRSEAVKVMAMEGYFDSELETKTMEAMQLGFFRRIRSGLSRVGRFVKEKAKKVGAAVKKVATVVYDKTIGAVKEKLDKFVKGLKEKFSQARFKGEKVCTTSNSKGESICLYDKDMVQFVRKQGDISSMRYSKQFAHETLIGVEILHIYVGAVGYAGTKLDCETNSFDIVIFGRGAAKAKLFNRDLPILTAEIELNKRTGQNLGDRAYLKLLNAVVYNKPFVPENIRKAVDTCQKHSRPLMNRVRKTLGSFSFSIVVVVVPLTFTLEATGEMGVDLVSIVCPMRLTLTASIEPYFGVGIKGKAGVGFAIVSGGVTIGYEANYRLQPGFGTSNCNLCAVLQHTVRPLNIDIGLYASGFGKKFEKSIYKYSGKPIQGTLFKLCMFPNKPYNPESVLGGAF